MPTNVKLYLTTGENMTEDDRLKISLDSIAATTFPPSSHDHDARYYTESEVDAKTFLKANTDNRSVATVPYDYVSKFDIKGLKFNTTLGISNEGTFSYLMGLKGWSDQTGGPTHELAFGNNGGVYHRIGDIVGSTEDTWKSWRKLAYKDEVDLKANISDVWQTSVVRPRNTVLAAPSTGSGGATFRTLMESDIPNITSDKILTSWGSGTDKTLTTKLGEIENTYLPKKSNLNGLYQYKNVGGRYFASSSNTGAVVIDVGTANLMLNMRITIRSYNYLAEIIVGGYTYTFTVGWHLPQCFGNVQGNPLNVRFRTGGINGSRYITIGDTNTSWGDYLQVSVDEINVGYGGDSLQTPVGVSLETVYPGGTLSATYTINTLAKQNEVNAALATKANLNSPTFTGNPQRSTDIDIEAHTPDKTLATTKYVDDRMSGYYLYKMTKDEYANLALNDELDLNGLYYLIDN